MRVERALKSVGWLGGNGHGPIIIEAERRRARRRAREAKRLKGERAVPSRRHYENRRKGR